MKLIQKVILTSAITGILAAGCTYGGVTYWHDRSGVQQISTARNSGASGRASIDHHSVNVSEQSEAAYRAVKGSVVSVINMKHQPKTLIIGGMILHRKNNAKSMQAMSEGSGIVYKIHDGSAYIVTNNHVVNGSSELQVILNNGKKVTAQEVGSDQSNDLAVIKIDASHVSHTATFGDSNHVKVGETSLAIGSPMGSQYASSLTRGVISAKKRKVSEGQNNNSALRPTKAPSFDVIQTDAPINPGNSGGPLINLDGQVIGINSMKLASTPQGNSVEGIGFAIPSNKVVRIINQIIDNSAE